MIRILICMCIWVTIISCNSSKISTNHESNHNTKPYVSPFTISNPDAVSPFIPNLEQLYAMKTEDIVRVAHSYIGTPYRYGSASRKGTDCSGLTAICFRNFGLKLPRSSADQSKIGQRIVGRRLKVGDLVFFHPTPKSRRISHVGIISKITTHEMRFVHASSKRGVVEDNFLHHHWQKRFAKAIRAVHLLPTISFCEPTWQE